MSKPEYRVVVNGNGIYRIERLAVVYYQFGERHEEWAPADVNTFSDIDLATTHRDHLQRENTWEVAN